MTPVWRKKRTVELKKTTAQSDSGWIQYWSYGPLRVEWHTDSAPAPDVWGEAVCEFLMDGNPPIHAALDLREGRYGTWAKVRAHIELLVDRLSAQLGREYI